MKYQPSKMYNDLRFKYFCFYFLIAIVIYNYINEIVFNSVIKLSIIDLYDKVLWCACFTLTGFCILILKICINAIHNMSEADNQETEVEKVKNNWRYSLYYPLMLCVLTMLSVVISISQFNFEKDHFFISSALLSFFLGYFIDSLPNIIDKIGSKIKGE